MDPKRLEPINDSNKEEGEISDEEVQAYRSNNGRKPARNESRLPSPHFTKGAYSPYLGSKARARPAVGNTRFVRNNELGKEANSGARQLPDPNKILPSLMELRIKPSRHLSGNFPKPSAKIPNYHGDPLLNSNINSPSSRCILV